MTKLVEIKGIRAGQIWAHTEGLRLVEKVTETSVEWFPIAEGKPLRIRQTQAKTAFRKSGTIVGKFAITHTLIQGIVDKVERKGIVQRDDILYIEGVANVVTDVYDDGKSLTITLFDGRKTSAVKIVVDPDLLFAVKDMAGIFGVTHEFVNDCEA